MWTAQYDDHPSNGTPSMTTILRDLPYFDARSVVVVRNRHVPIKPQQIVVWVSLAEIEQNELLPGTPRFPAILDTGCSHNFGIREEHLIQWAGLQSGAISGRLAMPALTMLRLRSITPTSGCIGMNQVNEMNEG